MPASRHILRGMKPPSKGQVLLSRAMVARGHNVTDAAALVKAGLGVLGRVLAGKRGVGTDLAARIESAYPEVPMRAWAETAADGETMVDVPRGRAPRGEVSP